MFARFSSVALPQNPPHYLVRRGPRQRFHYYYFVNLEERIEFPADRLLHRVPSTLLRTGAQVPVSFI